MSFLDSVRDTVATIAPTIGAAIGGPLGGLAGQALASVLGVDPTDEKALVKAVQSMTPEQALALKQAEIDFQKRMAELDVDLARINGDDRNSARQREMTLKDHVPSVLAYSILGAFIAMVGVTLLGYAKADSALAGTLIGYLSAKSEQVLSYYFGSSAGSREKTKLLGGLNK